MGFALKIAPGEGGGDGVAGAGGGAGELEQIDGDGGVGRERLDVETDRAGKRFLVGILEILGEALDELVEPLREGLRAGVQGAGGDILGGGETDVAGEAKPVREGAVVGADDGLRDAGGDEGGRELGLPGDLETQRPGRGAAAGDGHFDGNHRGAGAEGAGDGGEPVLGDRAKDGAGVGDFERGERGRQNRDDIGGAHREFDVAQGKHRMTEGRDAGAVDPGDGAGAGDRDVAGGERDGNGAAGAQGGRRREVCGRRSRGRRAAAERGDLEAEGGELRRKQVGYRGGQTAQREDGPEGVVARRGGNRRRRAGARGGFFRADRSRGERRRGEVGFVADLGEIGGGREAGVAHGLEALDLVTEGAGEFALDVERAAAHAGDGAHVLHAGIGELAEDDGFAGAEGVADDAGYFDVKRFGFGAAEHGPDLAVLAGAEVVEGNRGEGRRRGLGVEEVARETREIREK